MKYAGFHWNNGGWNQYCDIEGLRMRLYLSFEEKTSVLCVYEHEAKILEQTVTEITLQGVLSKELAT